MKCVANKVTPRQGELEQFQMNYQQLVHAAPDRGRGRGRGPTQDRVLNMNINGRMVLKLFLRIANTAHNETKYFR